MHSVFQPFVRDQYNHRFQPFVRDQSIHVLQSYYVRLTNLRRFCSSALGAVTRTPSWFLNKGQNMFYNPNRSFLRDIHLMPFSFTPDHADGSPSIEN